jgi:ABC-2 type transport system permease protein
MSAWQAFVATWRAILQDKAALLLLFVSGVVYSFFYPLPYNAETVQGVPIAVVDQDNSALSRQLIRYADAHPGMRIVAVSGGARDAQALLWQGEAAGTLMIPPDFSAKVLAGGQSEVEVGGHGAYPLLNKVALNGLAEVVGTLSAGIEIKRLGAGAPVAAQLEAQRQPLATEALPLFNVAEGYASYIVPGVVVLLMQQTFLLGAGLLFGTWRDATSFPYPASGAAYFGALHAFALVIMLNALYFFGFVLWWQDYPRGGNWAGSAALTIVFAYCVAALGIYMGLFFRTRERSVQLLIATSMPVVFLSGLTWPVSALPEALQALRWLLPSTAGIQGLIATNQMGASVHEVRRELAALLALGLLFTGLGLRKWTQRQGG